MHNTGNIESLIELIREQLKPDCITGWFHLLAILDEIKLTMEGKDPGSKRKGIPLTLNGEKAARVEEVEKRLSAIVLSDPGLLALRSGYDVRTLRSVQAARDFAKDVASALEAVCGNLPGMIHSVLRNFRARAVEAADQYGFGELDHARIVPTFFFLWRGDFPRETKPTGYDLIRYIRALNK